VCDGWQRTLCAVAACAGFLTAACDRRETAGEPVDVVQDHPGAEIGESEFGLATSVEDVTEDINRFVGRRLTLEGEVVRVLGARVFAMGGEGVAYNQEVIVVSRHAIPELKSESAGLPRAPDPTVRVVGVLRPFSPAEIEQQFGTDVLTDLRAVSNSRPLLIADAVRPVPVPGPQQVGPR